MYAGLAWARKNLKRRPCGLWIVLANIGSVPAAFGTIVRSAFSAEAGAGGLVGVLIQGFRRAAKYKIDKIPNSIFHYYFILYERIIYKRSVFNIMSCRTFIL